ncbi:hypothetical protein [Salipiger thiooxidans]|uniref:hypothetical protein n=1 Tax=Salipiger thiooxidans TaxID=282683 RepID=UPI001CF98B8F|nr:hypothetical protein [Salipiger thiooxidans]
MVKLVLLHKANSIYEDEPDVVYDFPRSYLRAIKEAVGDWIVYYEPVKAGPKGYFAVAKISDVIPKPNAEGAFPRPHRAGQLPSVRSRRPAPRGRETARDRADGA